MYLFLVNLRFTRFTNVIIFVEIIFKTVGKAIPSSPVSASSLVSSVPKTRRGGETPPPPAFSAFLLGLMKLRKKLTNLPLFRFQTGS